MNKKDLLSPDTSPQQLKPTGIKRVNNLPLILAMAVLTIFIILIALVAQKRAMMQKHVIPPIQLKIQKKNTMNLAEEIVKHDASPITTTPNQLDTKPQEQALSMPAQQSLEDHQALDRENQSNIEIERIHEEKMQAFQEAVNAKTAITMDNTQLNSRLYSNNKQNYELDHDVRNTTQNQLMQQKSTSQPLGGEENASRWRLNSTLENPNSPYELRAGNVIPGIMISGISSELPGQIVAQVSQNIYDTPTGKYLLIPQGTRIIGIYSSDVSFGQDSLLVAWQRLVFPDGKALDIGAMPGADSAGLAGFRDQVNHHYARIYGSALLMSGIVGGITYSQTSNQQNQLGTSAPTASSVLSQALGQQLGEVTSQLVAKNLNVSPTIQVRPGYRFNIVVIKDLTFNQPYQAFA